VSVARRNAIVSPGDHVQFSMFEPAKRVHAEEGTVMKRSYLLRITGMLVAALVATSSPADRPADAVPRVTVTIERGDVVIAVDNPGNADIDIAYPLPLTYGSELGGIQLEFRRTDDPSGKLLRLCASVDEGLIPVRRRLAPGERVDVRWDLAILKAFYCLDSGEHEVIANFVDKVDTERLSTPARASTRVHID
jgi:hypothetical protein